MNFFKNRTELIDIRTQTKGNMKIPPSSIHTSRTPHTHMLHLMFGKAPNIHQGCIWVRKTEWRCVLKEDKTKTFKDKTSLYALEHFVTRLRRLRPPYFSLCGVPLFFNQATFLQQMSLSFEEQLNHTVCAAFIIFFFELLLWLHNVWCHNYNLLNALSLLHLGPLYSLRHHRALHVTLPWHRFFFFFRSTCSRASQLQDCNLFLNFQHVLSRSIWHR